VQKIHVKTRAETRSKRILANLKNEITRENRNEKIIFTVHVPRESQQSMIRQTYLYFKTKNNRSMMMVREWRK